MTSTGEARPDIVILMTDEERAAPSYEPVELARWRDPHPAGHAVVPRPRCLLPASLHGLAGVRAQSRPTIFTGHYPDVHGVTQTDGLGKDADDSRMRWLPEGEVPTLGHWFRAAGYDTHYDGKWHISHADLHDAEGRRRESNTDDGEVIPEAVQAYLDADPLGPYGFSGWVGPEPHGASISDSGLRRDPLIADRVVAWLDDRYARRRAGDAGGAASVPPGGELRQPPRHRALPGVGAPDADQARPARPAARDRGADAERGPLPQAVRADRLPGVLPVGLRSAVRHRPDLPHQRPAVPRPLLPPARRGRHPARPRTPGGHRGGLAPTPSWCARPTTASCSARTAGCTRSGSTSTTRPPASRSIIARVGAGATAAAEVVGGPDLPRRPGPDPAVRSRPRRRRDRRHAARAVHRGAPAARPRPDAAGRGPGRRRPEPGGLPDDARQHARGRHGAVGPRPPPGAHGQPAATAADPGGGPRRLQLRGCRRPGGRGRRAGTTTCGSWSGPSTTPPPGPSPARRHLAANGLGRSGATACVPLPDQWELYDLDADPIEAVNRWDDPSAASVFAHLRVRLAEEQRRCVPAAPPTLALCRPPIRSEPP